VRPRLFWGALQFPAFYFSGARLQTFEQCAGYGIIAFGAVGIWPAAHSVLVFCQVLSALFLLMCAGQSVHAAGHCG